MAKREIPELREKSELRCMWGLFGILESCQGSAGPKLISNGRRVDKHILDYPRELDLHFTSFDEECRKIKNGVDLASVPVDGKRRNRVNSIQADMPFEKNKTMQSVMKREEHSKMDSNNDRLMESHKGARKNSQKASQSTSAEISLNKLSLGAILGAVSAHDHREKSSLSEYFERSIHRGKYDEVEEFNMQQVQMSAKAFVDQMFIDRQLICKQRRSSESNNSFSDALEVLNSNRDLFVKNLGQFQTENETGLESVNSEKGEIKRTASLPSNKIVILKPAPENSKEINCHCSFQRSLSRKVSDNKPTSFSFREMKKKLKHTFGGSRKELNEFDIDKLSIERSSARAGDDCTCGGLEIGRSFSSSTSSRTNEKQDSKSNTGFSDVACMTETVRKKLDSSRFVSSKRHEFDVISEAKRHLSTRLKSLYDVEAQTEMRQKSPRTLGRILLSPEPDFWPISPKRDRNGRKVTCLSPSRPNTEITSCDDCSRYDGVLQKMDSKMKSNGESHIVELNIKFQPESHISEAAAETMESHKDAEIHVMHCISDSLSENEASTSTVDDLPSTPSSSIKYQEEHRSPDSVLEPFFSEDTNSPPSTTPQTGRPKLQPLRLDFEECSLQPSPRDQSITANCCTEEQDHLSEYVHLVLQASCLNWDLLSEIRYQSHELLHESLFDEVEFLHDYFDPKLLFDHINEVLVQIHRSHFCLPPWQTFARTKVEAVPLAEAVVDEILKEADFYLLPRTEKRTLDQLVSKDVAECTSWLNVRLDTEEIMIDTSEVILEESILDILIELHKS